MNITIVESKKKSDEINKFLIDTYCNYVTKCSAFQGMNVTFYESRIGEKVKNIFVVRIDKRQATILNKFYLDVEEDEITLLLEVLSNRYGVNKLFFNKLFSPPALSETPHIQEYEIVDNIADLPPSFSMFIDSLGKNTKKHSKYYLGRMQRDFPDVEYNVYENQDISRSDFDSITNFSRERMAQKNLPYGATSHDGWLFTNVTADCGYLSSVKIQNQIVAGCVGFVCGEHLYLSKIAHDPKFNNYNAGQVALLRCIEWAIEEKGVKKFHYLWGKNVDYKDRFGGCPHLMYNLVIFKKIGFPYYFASLKSHVKEAKQSIMDFLRSNKSLLKFYHKITYSHK